MSQNGPALATSQCAVARIFDSQKTQLNINDVNREILVLMHSELNQHDVSLATALSGGLEPMIGDLVQLRQVVSNLIMNRIEAMTAVMYQPQVLISQIDGAGDFCLTDNAAEKALREISVARKAWLAWIGSSRGPNGRPEAPVDATGHGTG